MCAPVANGTFNTGPQIYLQLARIRSHHFGVCLNFWLEIESIAGED